MKLIKGPPVRFQSLRVGDWFFWPRYPVHVFQRTETVKDRVGFECRAVALLKLGDDESEEDCTGETFIVADDEIIRKVNKPSLEI